MKFDKFITQYISEAAGDLPPNIREFGGTGLTSSGALGRFLAKKDKEQLAQARGKAREELGGDLFRRVLLSYQSKIAEGYKQLKAENFTSKNDDEKQAVEEFKTWGLGEEPAEILYVLGGKIAKNLWSLNNLKNATPKEKKIPILTEKGDLVAELTIQTVAREALDKFYDLFKENAKKGSDNKLRWPELSSALYMDSKDGPIMFVKGYGEGEKIETTKIDPKTRGRLAFKQLVDVLRTFAPKGSKLLDKNKLFGWALTTRQIQGSNNYFALDVRSTPNHWFIYINAKGEGKEEGGKLRTLYGSIDDPTKKYRIQKTKNLPIKFVNGVPKYGVQLTEKELYSTLGTFLDLIGYDTIYDVLYAKYVKKDKKFKMPDGKVIDLEKLKISEYRLTVPSVERRATEEKIAKTPLRPEYRPKPMAESLESSYEKVLNESKY